MAIDIRDCQLQLEFYRASGSSPSQDQLLAQVPVQQIDVTPLIECAKLQLAATHPRRPFVLDHAGDAVIEPAWDGTLGTPYIEGVRVSFGDAAARSDAMKIPLSFLTEAAKSATLELVQAGRLVSGDTCRYRVCAYSRDRLAASSEAPETESFAVQPVVEPLSVKERCISDLLQKSTAVDEQTDSGLTVFVPHSLLGELHDLTRAAGPREEGGILVGYLGYDPQIPEICVEVTAQIQVAHAQQELTSLTLTPDTWAAASAAVALRNRGEVYLGWWHSHPARQWCADCPEEKRKACRLRSDFFSAQDRALHRCCFSRAFSVALVVTDNLENNLTTAMYGWREGTVQRRGYRVLDDG